MLAYIAAESIHHLLSEDHADTTLIGIVLTAVALLTMPILGRAKHKPATRLGSTATAGEGTQNHQLPLPSECIQLHRGSTDPQWYELNLWKGTEYFDETGFYIRRARRDHR